MTPPPPFKGQSPYISPFISPYKDPSLTEAGVELHYTMRFTRSGSLNDLDEIDYIDYNHQVNE